MYTMWKLVYRPYIDIKYLCVGLRIFNVIICVISIHLQQYLTVIGQRKRKRYASDPTTPIPERTLRRWKAKKGNVRCIRARIHIKHVNL